MTDDEIVEAVRRMKRTAEMSAEIMRDKQRTGAWEGAEKVARQFDRLAERASDVFAALSSAGRQVREGEPSDIRAAGWSVAVHNDYRLNGEAQTFWLFTKGNTAVKGEGRTDAEALNAVRSALASAPHPAPDATDTQSRAMDIIERAAKRIEEIGDPLAAAQAENEKLRKLLARYRNETPLGHQPHMIAHEADKALALSPPPLAPESPNA